MRTTLAVRRLSAGRMNNDRCWMLENGATPTARCRTPGRDQRFCAVGCLQNPHLAMLESDQHYGCWTLEYQSKATLGYVNATNACGWVLEFDQRLLLVA